MNILLRYFVFLSIAMFPANGIATEAVRIANGPLPSQSIRNWHLKEKWRAGPEGDRFLFGFIIDVGVDTEGNVYLLDYQQQETCVFDSAGKFQFVRGGQGEGPGETTMASQLFIGTDRLGLMNRFPAEIVWLDAAGDPAGSVIPRFAGEKDGFLGCWSGKFRHQRIVLSMTLTVFDGKIKDSRGQLVGCSSDGIIQHVYLDLGDAYLQGSRDDVVDEGAYYNPLAGRWDLDSEGLVWIAPERDRYLVRALDETGRVVLETTREFDRPDRPDTEINKIRASINRKWEASGLPIVVGEKAPCIEKLWILENRWGTEIWIESAASHHELPPGVMVRYDLFDLEGKFTHQVDIVGDGDPLFDRWYLIGDNRLIMVRNASSGGFDEDDPDHPRSEDGDLEVISYRILWEE